MSMVPTEESEMPAPSVQGGAFEGMKENPFNLGANEGEFLLCDLCSCTGIHHSLSPAHYVIDDRKTAQIFKQLCKLVGKNSQRSQP